MKIKGNRKEAFTPAPWQMEPERIKTETVQVWSKSGVMLTAQCSLEGAREMVTDGTAFIISSQAVGLLCDGLL